MTELTLKFYKHFFDDFCFIPNRTRHPVDRAELVDDGALDAADRVRLELVPAARVELVDRVDEAENSVADEVGLLDVLGQARGDTTRHEFHEGRVVKDEALPCVTGALEFVVLPELGDCRRQLVHGGGTASVRHEGASVRTRLSVGRGSRECRPA